MGGHESNQNVAVIENRVSNIEGLFHELHDIVKGQATVNANLEKSIALLQQSFESHERECREDFKPKLKTLWDNWGKLKGAYLVISCLCGLLVGGAVVGGFVYEVWQHSNGQQHTSFNHGWNTYADASETK